MKKHAMHDFDLVPIWIQNESKRILGSSPNSNTEPMTTQKKDTRRS